MKKCSLEGVSVMGAFPPTRVPALFPVWLLTVGGNVCLWLSQQTHSPGQNIRLITSFLFLSSARVFPLQEGVLAQSSGSKCPSIYNTDSCCLDVTTDNVSHDDLGRLYFTLSLEPRAYLCICPQINTHRQGHEVHFSSGLEIQRVFNRVISFLCQNRNQPRIAAGFNITVLKIWLYVRQHSGKNSDWRAKPCMCHKFYFCIYIE